MLPFAGFIAYIAGILVVAPHPGAWGIRGIATVAMAMLADHCQKEKELSKVRTHIWGDFILGLIVGVGILKLGL